MILSNEAESDYPLQRITIEEKREERERRSAKLTPSPTVCFHIDVLTMRERAACCWEICSTSGQIFSHP